MTAFVSSRIRSSLYTIYEASQTFGQLIGFIVINYFDYKQQARIFVFGPIIYFLVFGRIPQSPIHLSKANKQHVRYKNNHDKPNEVLLIFCLFFLGT